MGINIDTSTLSRALDEMDRRRLFAQQTYAQNAAKQLESQAKAGAPWTDRTGHARGGLSGTSQRRGSVFTITLSGSVRYMVYLELAHGKKWAVLWPTMQKNSQQILQGFARIGGLK